MPPDPTTPRAIGFCDVGVVIPAFRAAGTVTRALDSLVAQTLRPKEVVVVDDGSDEGTFEAAVARKGDMGGINLTVLRQDNQGPGAARNRALGELATKYVAFLDADDEWLPRKLEVSMQAARGESLIFVAHDMVAVGIDGREEHIDCARHHRRDEGFQELYKRGYVATSTVVALREPILAAGGFDTELANAQDFDLWLKILTPPQSRFRVFAGAFTRHHRMEGSVQTHTDRRLKCTMAVAACHAGTIKRKGGGMWSALMFRLAAVHGEAVAAFWQRRDLAGVARTLVLAPFRIFACILRVSRDRTGFVSPP